MKNGQTLTHEIEKEKGEAPARHKNPASEANFLETEKTVERVKQDQIQWPRQSRSSSPGSNISSEPMTLEGGEAIHLADADVDGPCLLSSAHQRGGLFGEP